MGDLLTFEELQKKFVATLDELTALKEDVKILKASDDGDEDDKTKDAFLKAQEDMKKDDDEKEAVKSAFKKANDETDPEKKKEAMKKAMEVKEENDKKHEGKKATSDDEKKDDQKDAKIAALTKEITKGTVSKILEAARMFEPQNVKAIEKKLKTASLEEIQKEWAVREPYVAAMGMNVGTAPKQETFVPFQASIGEGGNPEVDISKMNPEKLIRGMYS